MDSHLVVERKSTDDPRVHGDDRWQARYVHALRHRLDQLPLRLYPSRSRAIFSQNRVPSGVVGRVRALDPDIVHLHWVGDSFVTPDDVARFGVPVVWTLRDMWPFTGGCHYSRGCGRYADACGECPVLGSTREHDLSRSVWERKEAAWKGVSLAPVGVSRWIADRAGEEPLFAEGGVRMISNAVDIGFWSPGSGVQRHAGPRERILFVALSIDDDYKGFDLFADACRRLSTSGSAVEADVVVVGESRDALRPDLGLDTTYVGRIDSDLDLRHLYRSAHVTVVPSTEEAFGKTAAESIACGTPVVCFDDTGVADIVDHGVNGYRARLGDSEDLATGLAAILDSDDYGRMRLAARATAVESFSVVTAAGRYCELYDQLAGG